MNTYINKIARYVCLVGIFILPFIPIIVANNFFFPFITGKNFTFRIIVEIIFGAWLILAVTDKAYRPRSSWLLWILAGFVAVIALADSFGVYPYKSFWSNYERMEGFITLAHAFAYFLVASAILNSEKLWNRFWNTSIGVSLYLVLYGFIQFFGRAVTHQGDRLDASLGNSAYFAVYLLFHIFVVLYIVASRRWNLLGMSVSRTKWIAGGIIVLLQSFILFNTGTRGSILGLFAGLGLTALLIAIFDREHRKMRIASGIVIASLALIIVGFIGVKDQTWVRENKVLNRFASISLTETTTQSRFLLWKMAFKGFQERPILGWGQEAFNYVFNENYNPKLYNNEQWFDRTHNVIFDWLIAGGILGLLGYLAFFGALIWYIWRGDGDQFSIWEKSVLTGLLTAYFIHNFFVFDNLISYIMYFSFASYIYARRTYLAAPRSHEIAPNQVIAPIAIVATAFLVYILNAPAIQANTTLIKAITTTQQTNIDDNLADFKKALAYNSFGSPEIREQLFAMTNSAVNAAMENPAAGEVATQFLSLASEESKKQLAHTPRDARYYLIAGSTFARAGDYAQAIPLLEKGVELSPTKQSALFELASAYIGANQFEKAFVQLEKAYKLEPSYDLAKMMYAVGAIYAKKDDVASSVLKDYTKEEVAQSDQILRAYYITGQNKKVLDVWKLRVGLEPTNLDVRISLAAAYLLNNDKNSAIAELRKAAEINPEFKAQADQYIQDIRSGKIK